MTSNSIHVSKKQNIYCPNSVMLVVLVSNEFLQRDNYTIILATLLNILGVSHLPFRSFIPDTRDHELLGTVL